jgi:5-methylcytosine-specific restriction enzyme A
MQSYQRSPAAADYHRLYNLRRWRRRARRQLLLQPLCEQCAALGVLEPATVADHIVPHNGDLHLFLMGDLQSLCGPHHSGAKQSAERAGVEYSSEVGPDGLPIDPRHPANR